MKVTEQLKAECQKYGNEQLFYIAWGNQSTYEATHQNYQKADEIVNEINDYAEEQNSFWGHYIALHTKAVNDLQKQDYEAAELGFRKAVDFRHKYFPNESAGDDLQELMKIANHRKDQKAGLKYARQILAEPNVAPIHKGRALFRLSQFAFNKKLKLELGVLASQRDGKMQYDMQKMFYSAAAYNPTYPTVKNSEGRFRIYPAGVKK